MFSGDGISVGPGVGDPVGAGVGGILHKNGNLFAQLLVLHSPLPLNRTQSAFDFGNPEPHLVASKDVVGLPSLHTKIPSLSRSLYPIQHLLIPQTLVASLSDAKSVMEAKLVLYSSIQCCSASCHDFEVPT